MRLHEIDACSVAKHSSEKSPPAVLTALLGGFVKNFGGGNTTNVVVEDASPKGFVALHAYEPESLLIVLRKVINSLDKATLFIGKTPVNFVHVTVGDGKPVTWHRGSLKFCPVLARMGPGDSLTRGGAEKKNRYHIKCVSILEQLIVA